jgi:DNA-binding response OmpR family regulator
MADLLILEPDPVQGMRMSQVLGQAGHTSSLATCVSDGEKLLARCGHVTTLLNARLPWRESRAFLRLLEEKGLPVLFIAGEEANVRHLRALYQSCCDVLMTPFSDEELVNAVADLVKYRGNTLALGGLRMDVSARRVTRDGEELSLTTQEFELLRALMRSAGTAVSRQELLRTAWGYQSDGLTRTVDVHIQRLRKKLGATQIETVYKTGYRLLA